MSHDWFPLERDHVSKWREATPRCESYSHNAELNEETEALMNAVVEIVVSLQAQHHRNERLDARRARRLAALTTVSSIRQEIDRISKDSLAIQAYRLLTPLEEALAKADSVDALLPMVIRDDNLLSMEFQLADRRLGIVFESSPRDSSWFSVFDPSADCESTCGDLLESDMKAIIEGFFGESPCEQVP